MTTLLIDGDTIAYASAYANETKIDWGDGEPVVSHDEDAAIEAVDRAIADLKRTLGVKQVILTVSCPTAEGWRRTVLETYKSNRAGAVPPVALAACRKHLLGEWKAYLRPTLEADDILGILATHPTLVKGEKIIVSIDKDLLQVPGRVYNPRSEAMVRVTEDDGDYLHMKQTLTGDTVDGYTGIPGVGPKTAGKLLGTWGLDTPSERWLKVVEAYVSRGVPGREALVQARVARICRHTDYDFKQKKVKLWTPPSTLEVSR